jgi:hypothetical protein
MSDRQRDSARVLHAATDLFTSALPSSWEVRASAAEVGQRRAVVVIPPPGTPLRVLRVLEALEVTLVPNARAVVEGVVRLVELAAAGASGSAGGAVEELLRLLKAELEGEVQPSESRIGAVNATIKATTAELRSAALGPAAGKQRDEAEAEAEALADLEALLRMDGDGDEGQAAPSEDQVVWDVVEGLVCSVAGEAEGEAGPSGGGAGAPPPPRCSRSTTACAATGCARPSRRPSWTCSTTTPRPWSARLWWP